MGSNTGLTSGRTKCKAAMFKRKSAIPTIARSARNIVTLDIVALDLLWLSTTAVAWFVSVPFVNILKTSFILSVCDIPAALGACGKRSFGSLYGSPPSGAYITRLWLDFFGA